MENQFVCALLTRSHMCVMVISIKEDVYDEIYIAEVAVDIVDKDVFRMR